MNIAQAYGGVFDMTDSNDNLSGIGNCVRFYCL